MNKLFGIITAIMVSSTCFSQTQPDTVSLREVEIVEPRYQLFSAGIVITRFDSSTLALNKSSSLAELLTQHASVSIKNYGSGSLSSISFRGTNSGQTQINWNGFQINSSTAGEFDLNLAPVSFMDEISIVHGGSGSLYGSSAIGGSIQLENRPAWEPGSIVQLFSGFGSFSTFNSQLKIVTGNQTIQSSTNLSHYSTKNNFPFRNTALYGTPLVRQTNAEALQNGFMQSFYVKLGTYNTIQAHLWYQDNERQIPPIMSRSSGNAFQRDSSFRSIIGWNNVHRNGSFSLKTAYFNEFLGYSDPDVSLVSSNKVYKYLNEGELRHYFFNQKLLLNLGLAYSNINATVDTYRGMKTQDRSAVFAGIRFDPRPGLKLSLTGRQEFVAGYDSPFSPAAGLEIRVYKSISIKSSYSRNFNIPTLNERYWMPGGNPDLKPETGWNADIGMISTIRTGKNTAEFELTAYSSQVDNWIQWAPLNSSFWSPVNLKRVWARGLEARAQSSFQPGKFRISLSGNYAYTLSTNEEAYNAIEFPTIGKQLIYTPVHKGTIAASIVFRTYSITYSHSFTGHRYTDPENDTGLNSYSLANLSVQKKLPIENTNLFIRFSIANLFNTEYQSVAFWATPGRSYMLSAQFELNTRKNKL